MENLRGIGRKDTPGHICTQGEEVRLSMKFSFVVSYTTL